MPEMNHPNHKPFRSLRVSVLGTVLIATLVVMASCRKREPDELVTRPKPTTTSTPSFGGFSSGGSETGTGGAPQNAAGGVAGTGGAEPAPVVQCEATVTPLDGPFTKVKLLQSAAECANSVYCKFTRDAQRLRDATASAVSSTNKDLARDAWLRAIATWQEAEMFRFGPAASSTSPGGGDFRDLIYSWPIDGRCKVDEQTVNQFYLTPTFRSSPKDSFVGGRSLSALEYLLFYDDADNGCSQFSSINAKQTWALLSPEQLTTRKAEYAARAADDVLSNAIALINAWAPTQGNFHSQFLTAGAGSTAFPTEQAALNALGHALFYLDKELKDYKLALPMGLAPECPATRCPERVESRYAHVSSANLRANLRGFRKLFQGCGANGTGIGFDDWLQAVGKGELADRMLSALSAAEVAVDALDPVLERAIDESPASVQAVYDAIKAITDPLKTEFVTALNIDLPGSSMTDND